MPGGRYDTKPISDRLYPEYKFRELLTTLGSDQAIQNLIGSYGFETPPLAVIRGWRTRNSIPSRWLPLLIHKAMHDGSLNKPGSLLKTPF